MSDPMTSKRLRVVHVTSSFGSGGADRQILVLARMLAARGHDARVISLTELGPMGLEARRGGLCVRSLGIPRGAIDPSAPVRLAAILRSLHPDVVQAWMYHGNVLVSMARFLPVWGAPILWNIRHSLYRLDHESWLTRQFIRAHRVLASTADRILYNSELSARQHEAFGFPRHKTEVVANGIDCGRFRSRSIPPRPDRIVVGCVARHHPQKDHATLFAAIRLAAEQVPDLHLVLAGVNIEESNGDLVHALEQAAIRDRTSLLGSVDAIAEVYRSLDFAVLSSAYGEGFPNTLGEAMACGVPCVTTNVGDAALIVGDAGRVVECRDPRALAEALIDLARLDRSERTALSHRARQRILDHFGVERMTDRYEALYGQALERWQARRRPAAPPTLSTQHEGRRP